MWPKCDVEIILEMKWFGALQIRKKKTIEKDKKKAERLEFEKQLPAIYEKLIKNSNKLKKLEIVLCLHLVFSGIQARASRTDE